MEGLEFPVMKLRISLSATKIAISLELIALAQSLGAQPISSTHLHSQLGQTCKEKANFDLMICTPDASEA